MRRLRELLRLKHDAGLSHRAIAQACAVGLGTVTTYLQRVAAAGLSWPLPDDMDDAALEARVFARPAVRSARDRVVPDWSQLHQELKKPGVTLSLLWLEYRARHPAGYGYSQFCERYRRWARALKPSMRQVHRAGEKLFVDFSGKRPSLVDATTGEVVVVELFVGVLGASGLIYAEATRSQDLAAWVGAHVRMVEYFGGSPAIWVPGQPEERRDHRELLRAGDQPDVYRPRAPLWRHRAAGAHSPPERQTQSRSQCADRPAVDPRGLAPSDLVHPGGLECRDSHVPRRGQCPADADRGHEPAGALRAARSAGAPPAAGQPLRAGDVKPCRVNIDYHVEAAHNWYSVPYQLVHAHVEARVTQTTVEVFLSGRRVASHARLTGRGRFSTQVAHMPRAHRAHAEWTPSRLIGWADQAGPATGAARRRHPRTPPASRAGLSRVSRAHAAGPGPRAGPARRRLCARRAAPLLPLSHGRAHSHPPAGPAPARRARACATRPDAREPARGDLLRGGLC